MGNFREQLDLLESAVAIRFSELCNANPNIEFLTQEDVDNCDFTDYFDVRNSTTGETYEVSIVSVTTPGGILVIDPKDFSKTKLIGLSDLASTYDRISLVESMEAKLKYENNR